MSSTPLLKFLKPRQLLLAPKFGRKGRRKITHCQMSFLPSILKNPCAKSNHVGLDEALSTSLQLYLMQYMMWTGRSENSSITCSKVQEARKTVQSQKRPPCHFQETGHSKSGVGKCRSIYCLQCRSYHQVLPAISVETAVTWRLLNRITGEEDVEEGPVIRKRRPRSSYQRQASDFHVEIKSD